MSVAVLIIAPAKPENLQVVETPNLVNFSYYDLEVSWSVPEYIPEYYNIWFESLAENGSKEFNISGVRNILLCISSYLVYDDNLTLVGKF